MNDYERIARVIRYLDQHQLRQPAVSELAGVVGLSESHFHRMFTRWAGVTPKSFLQCLTLEHAKQCLARGDSVLDASLACGLSGPGRLHDLCVGLEAASPGEIKRRGAGWTVRAGFAASPFGHCLVAVAPRGVCHLSFVESPSETEGESAIRQDWPRCLIQWDNAAAEDLVPRCFARNTNGASSTERIHCLVSGTPFQVRVWKALLQIPPGALLSYQQIATLAGRPNAARAAGNALAQNSIACLIPCHRVIRSTGVIGHYRWGTTRKRAIQAVEFHRACDEMPAPNPSHATPSCP